MDDRIEITDDWVSAPHKEQLGLTQLSRDGEVIGLVATVYEYSENVGEASIGLDDLRSMRDYLIALDLG